MARKEKFGKFVLLDEIDSTGLGQEYRAAKLGTTGMEKIVTLLRLKPSLSANAEAAKSLMDQIKFAAQLQNPNILKTWGIGKVDSSYYVSYEFLEGKNLKAIFNRCRTEGFPFSADHALLITSKVCSALEYAHGRRNEAGSRYFHGLITPSTIVVSYEGEVRLRGFGVWPSGVRQAGGISDDELAYAAPEQLSGTGDSRSDIFGVGTILFETLTGQRFVQDGGREDTPTRLAAARLQNPAGDDDALPRPIADILGRALAAEPASRYAEVQEMRKGVDTLLFSGDFTPTTFNLAFFMHSLFREDIERESKALKEEKEAPYFEYMNDEPSRAIAAAAGRPSPAPAPPAPPAPVGVPTAAASLAAVPASEPPDLRAIIAASAESPLVSPSPAPLARDGRAREAPVRAVPPVREAPPVREHAPVMAAVGADGAAATAKEAAAGFTFHKEGRGSRTPLIAAGAFVLLLVGGGAYWLLRGHGTTAQAPPPTPVTTLTVEAAAAESRVRELEDKLKALETERAAAEARAAEDAKKKVESQAAARGQTVDPAALQRAQDEARKKAQAEQERRQQEERARLEEEQRAAEARLAEERRRADEEARVAAATTTLPAPPPTTAAPAPTLRAGTLVNLSDPGVMPPVIEKEVRLVYPPIAQRQGLTGVVELNILVDERGNVIDAQLVTGTGGKSGMNEAAIANVKQRKYRPATKDGVPVKVWYPVRVQFVLQR